MSAKNIKRALTAISVMVFCIAPFGSAAASDNRIATSDWYLTVTEAKGLTAAPKDLSTGSGNLINASRMLPGDEVSAVITVRNECGFPVTLAVEVNNKLARAPEGEADLADKLEIRAFRGGDPVGGNYRVVGEGLVYEFTTAFDPNTETDLTFEFYLDGPSTGNEYQNKKAELMWIFTAVRAGEGDGGGRVGITASGTEDETEITDTPGIPKVEGSLPEAVDQQALAYSASDGSGAGEIIAINDMDVPLDRYEMPKTGEVSLWFSTLPGAALAALGLTMLIRNRGARDAHG